MLMLPSIKLSLTEADFKPVDSTLNYFHGPSLEILGCLFHTTAFAVEFRDDLHCGVDEYANKQYEALQGFYEGAYTTIQLRGKPCVLVIHPFSD
jgi:hypothetical protein